jgi:hypothetical protein
MRRLLGFGVCLAGLYASTALAQTPPPQMVGACDTQVQEQYRQLSTDGLVPQGTATAWGPQLTAITGQVRIMRTQYDIKKSQAELAEQNVSQLVEQLRLAQQQLASLRGEVDQLKAAQPVPTPAPAPPSN